MLITGPLFPPEDCPALLLGVKRGAVQAQVLPAGAGDRVRARPARLLLHGPGDSVQAGHGDLPAEHPGQHSGVHNSLLTIQHCVLHAFVYIFPFNIRGF